MAKIAIIGGGLAGCAAAYVLKQAGHKPIIYESQNALATKASGNAIGLYNPRFGAEWTPQSQYFAKGFELGLKTFPTLPNIDFDPCGALHLVIDEKKQTRFHKMIKSWPWDTDMMRFVNAHEASEIADIEIEKDCLYLPQSGSVSPKKLCEAYAKDVERIFNNDIDIEDIKADVIILANAKALTLAGLNHVRGQVTYIEATPQSQKLNCHLCYGGYMSRAQNRQHVVGATFQRWLDHDNIIKDDDADNLAKLFEAIPALENEYMITGHRAAIRVTSEDHFPIVGHLRDNIYISTAHGSHGILSSLTAAHIINAQIDSKAFMKDTVINALSPHRFSD